ncbi:MAG TPA: protein disulfide oxidoreductase [Myxococcales bacterium]|jgi:peroxiredoxin|nr:protein disulfide oxidoreductase [Myxococcales bacterium]
MSNQEPAKPSRKRRWLSIAAELLVFAALFLGVRAYTGRHVAKGLAPALEGLTPQGQILSLAQMRGEPVLVHFWASWCSVCKLEQGSIDSIAKGRDAQVLTVASGSGDAAKVAAYMKSEGLSFPTLVDEDGALAEAFGVKSFPTTLVVGPDGTVRFSEVGYTTRPGMLARLWWAGR